MTDHTFFAPTAPGLEDLLAEELRALGADRVRAARAGVSFSGPLAIAYRACLWSRTASRVLMRLVEVPANSAEELYDKVRAIRWEEHVAADGSIAVDFTGARSPITHSHYGALKVKDAVVDRFRDRTGGRPDVETDAPDLRINVAARTRSAVIRI
ncbi:MAG: THUMP domain-containing protein, partial [Coriobacteriia bacterium]|nr:THUMP domain-containing protein [Coriobacteriia bacterium]